MRTTRPFRAGVLLLAVLPIVLLSATALAQGMLPMRPGEPGVGTLRAIPPHSKAFGRDLAQWTAAAAAWAFVIPVPDNPYLAADDDELCGWPQADRVWYLSSQFCFGDACSRPRTFHCTVPAGKPVLYPFAGYTCLDYPPGTYTVEEMQAEAAYFTDMFVNLAATVDGKPVADLAARRVVTPAFVAGPMPADNIVAFVGLDAPEGSSYTFLQDNYTLLIPPLPPGPHVVHVTAEVPGEAIVDVTVHLDVVAGGRGAHAGAAGALGTPPGPAPSGWGRLKILYR